jgi:hypothetical protein
MPTTINASNTSGGAVVTGDGSGVLELQSGGVTALTANVANVTVAGNANIGGNAVVTGTLTATGGVSGGLVSPATIAGNATAGAEIRLPEDTDNGSNYVALKAPNALAANTTFTLPTADGTNGQYLQTNGTGQLAFATVPTTAPGGTTGQIQINNAGAFGAVASGTSGQVLVSQGAGNAPTWGGAQPVYNKVGDFVSPTSQYLFYAAGNINALTERGWTPGVAKFTSSTFGSDNPSIPANVNWSNYYNAWYALMEVLNPSTSTRTLYLCLSPDGINWWGAGDLPTISAPRALNTSCLGIDDSNGRFFMGWEDSTNYTAGIVYHTTPGNFISWTESGAIVNNTGYSTTPGIEDMQYVNFGTSSTSGLVLSFYSYAGSGFRFFVVPSGSVTPVSKATRYTTNNRGSIISWDYTNKKCVVFCRADNASQRVAYVENDVNGTWTTPSVTGFTATNFLNADVGGAYAVNLSSSTEYQYSNTYSSWTSASPPAGNIQALWHNGTYWFMRTTVGVYYTATAIPTGWTRIGTTNWLVTSQNPTKTRRTTARKA